MTIADPLDDTVRYVVHVSCEATRWYRIEDDDHTPMPPQPDEHSARFDHGRAR